jgi:hypothetical protein
MSEGEKDGMSATGRTGQVTRTNTDMRCRTQDTVFLPRRWNRGAILEEDCAAIVLFYDFISRG